MPDELDLVRSYRSDLPGPSCDAWARARAGLRDESGAHPRRIDGERRGRRRRRLTIAVVGAGAGLCALLSAVLVLGGSATAFGGWSATPSYLTAEQTTATQVGCKASLPQALATGGWSLVATDARGPYTMAVYESGPTLASCLIGPSFTSVQAESLSSDSTMVSATGGPRPSSPSGSLLSGGDIEQLLVSHDVQAGNGPYTVAEGRLDGQTVGAVTLVLSGGEDVTTTIGNGWLVAWWPGSQGVVAAQVTSADGTATDPLTPAALPAPPSIPAGHSPGAPSAVPANPSPVGDDSDGDGAAP
jgi:hypothetical protein